MKLMNPKTPVMASWLYEFGRRLDAGPFLSGAIESRKILEDLSVRKDPLCELTAGGMAGIIHAGRIPRIWVDDPDHGLPFLSSTDILQADLSKLSLISKRVVEANPKLVIRRGWTLITRSGTIGKTAFARPEMDGMACTEDVLRVVPSEQIVPAGYLYAFLSSRFGLPIITASTYGSIIQHLEPHHLANLPVPRFGKKLEQQVHDLVQEAAELRTESNGRPDDG
jgi:type I restriction enzyme, S subunit